MIASCLLSRDAALDIRPVGTHPILWDALYNNIWDFTPLAAIPAGLGLSFSFDGSSGTITTTTAGTWVFYYVFARGGDATYFGVLSTGLGSNVWDEASSFRSVVATLPSGAALDQAVVTSQLATSNPYNLTTCTIAIARIA